MIREIVLQDFRYATRLLMKNRGFTIVAILTLSLGIGANSAIFSAVYGILLKPLPYPAESRLVSIWAQRSAPEVIHHAYISVPEFDDIQAQNTAFEQMAEYSDQLLSVVTGEGVPERVSTMTVSGDFFSVLGVSPILGRPILSVDTQLGFNHVAIISYAFWQRHFGGRPDIIGKTIALDGQQSIVIGIMPSQFQFPSKVDIWEPLPSMDAAKAHRKWRPVAVVALLKPGVTLAFANSQVHTIATRLAAEYPGTDKGWDLSVQMLRDQIAEGFSEGLLFLLGAVTLIMLLACVNVSSLLIAKSWARRREVAIRAALGASRARLILQFLTESVLLALAGGALGIFFSYWALQVLKVIVPPNTPRIEDIALNPFILLYTLLVSVLAGILFGLAPAIQLTRSQLGSTLKEGSSSTFTRVFSRHPHSTRGFLVVSEIALAFVLVALASLAIRSFSRLIQVSHGYQIDHILTFGVTPSPSTCPPASSSPDRCNVTIGQMLERIRALSGVKSAGAVDVRPFSDTVIPYRIQVEGNTQSDLKEAPGLESLIVTPEYFSTVGVPILAGRVFTFEDTKGSLPVAVVNEAMAAFYFDGKPLGKRFRSEIVDMKRREPTWIEIVGEVGNTRDVNPSQKPLPICYIAYEQAPYFERPTFALRTSSSPISMLDVARRQVWSVDKDAAIYDIKTMDQLLSESVAAPYFQTLLLGSFGGLALLLSVIGIYGLMSYAVIQRTQEIGVRMALGAEPTKILRMVIIEAMLLNTAGITIGLGGALLMSRFLRSMLFEVQPTDPTTLMGVVFIIYFVVFAACFFPARRASRVDPVTALRYE